MTSENIININWPASKGIISLFGEQALDFERNKNAEFEQLTKGSERLTLLLMDLGHYGRGLQKFPVTLPLLIIEPLIQLNDSRNLTTATLGARLFESINDGIKQYESGLEPQSTAAKIIKGLKEDVDAIAALAIQTKDERIQLFLEVSNGSENGINIPDFYQIKGLDAANYRA